MFESSYTLIVIIILNSIQNLLLFEVIYAHSCITPLYPSLSSDQKFRKFLRMLSLCHMNFVVCTLDLILLYSVSWGAHTASYPMGTRSFIRGVKRPKREADHSPPSSSEVTNA